MSSVVVSGDTSGTITISAPAISGTNTLTLPAVTDTLVGLAATQTLTNKTVTAPVLSGSVTGTYTLAGTPTITSPTITGAVMSTMASSVITSGTSVATTSGTSIDFTGIPSWVKRITVMLNGVSLSSSSHFLIQLGAGSVETTSYVSTSMLTRVVGVGPLTSTSGLCIQVYGAAYSQTGHLVLTLMGSNLWVSSHYIMESSGGATFYGAGSKTTSGALDRVRLTTVNGTDTFDAGSVNILYE